MERMLSTEEKIRRAEEIYNRRQNENYRRTTATVNVSGKKEIKLFKKMAIQICICLLIYAVFYVINNKEYIFSEAVLQKSREILSYDINIKEMYQWGKDFTTVKFEELQSYLQSMGQGTENVNNESEENQENSKTNEAEIVENNEQVNSNSNEESGEDKTDDNTSSGEQNKTNENSENSNTENIGGAVEEEDTSSINQMQVDAEEIKKSINLIKPLEGTITSRFGVRNPTVSTVSKYHTGIDIAASKGTKIKSASEGVVELASSEGDYRKSFKNKKWKCDFYICTL